jgi:lysophospholipase L1-like esterase
MRASIHNLVVLLTLGAACGGDVAAPDQRARMGHAGQGGRIGASGASPTAGKQASAGTDAAGRSAVSGDAGTGGARGVERGGAGSAGIPGVGGQGRGSSGGAAADAGEADTITVWLAGDSTVANGVSPCPTGWGKHLGALFDARVQVINRAAGGRSVRTWLYDVQSEKDADGECVLARDAQGDPTLQERWQAMLDGMKAGDYLLIQFGINDSSSTCDRHVGTTAFKSSYGMMAEAAKTRGAQPVFITPVSSVACDGSNPRPSRAPYDRATVEAGAEHDVPVLDLEARSVELYAASGFCPVPGGDVSATTTGAVGDFFCDDHTHFSSDGARAVANLVANEVRDQDLPLASYLK